MEGGGEMKKFISNWRIVQWKSLRIMRTQGILVFPFTGKDDSKEGISAMKTFEAQRQI